MRRTKSSAFKSVVAGATALLTMVALSGCGGSPEPVATEDPVDESGVVDVGADGDLTALIEAAKAEGQVVFFGGQAEAVLQSLAAAFEEEYGIEAVYNQLATGPMVQLVDRQFDAGVVDFDVTLATDTLWVANHAAEGRWLPVDFDMPGIANIPQERRHDDYVETGYGLTAVVYNTDRVAAADVPKSMTDLTKPVFKDRIVSVDPNTAQSIAASYFNYKEKFGQAKFEEWMDGLAANGLKLVDSGANAAQQIAAGEFDIGMAISITFVLALMKSGAPVDYVFADPSVVAPRTAEIPVNAPHPNAAKLFVNFLLSEAGQEIINGGSSVGAYPNAAPSTLEYPSTAFVPDPQKLADDWDSIKEAVAKAIG